MNTMMQETKKQGGNTMTTNSELKKDSVIDVSVTPMRRFDELKEEEKNRVMELKSSLEDFSAESLIRFSSATSSTISRDTDDFLRNTKLNDLQEFNQIMMDLSSKLKSVDTEKLSEVKKSNPLVKLPVIGNFMQSSIEKKVTEVVAKQQSIEKVVSSTETTLEQVRLSLQEDLIRCSSMREKNIEYAKSLELECIALQLRKSELEAERESFMNSPSYNENNLDDVEYVGRLQDGILEISRKIDNTARFRLIAIQDLPTLKITRNADIAIVNTIEDAVVNLIPQWKKAFSKALLSYRLYNAATVMDAVHQASAEIFEQSAQITSAAVLKSAEMIEKPQVTSETLKKINESIIAMCDEVVRISTEAQEIREKDLPELKRMEQEALAIETRRK